MPAVMLGRCARHPDTRNHLACLRIGRVVAARCQSWQLYSKQHHWVVMSSNQCWCSIAAAEKHQGSKVDGTKLQHHRSVDGRPLGSAKSRWYSAADVLLKSTVILWLSPVTALMEGGSCRSLLKPPPGTRIPLNGPGVPEVIQPLSGLPVMFQSAISLKLHSVSDARSSTLSGVACGDDCSYC